MRVFSLIGVLLAGGAGSLSAQHAHQLEISSFGSYTRYDKDLHLANQFGAGGRVGYFLGDHFSLEVDANVAQPRSSLSGVGTTAVFWSTSLVINSGGGKSSLYALGGYSRLHVGPEPLSASDLNAVHGGLGERIFVGDRVALRVEGRAYYRGAGGGQATWLGHFTGTAGLSFILGGAGEKSHVP